jgi:hypothetical protein
MMKRFISPAVVLVCFFLAGQVEAADKAEIDAKLKEAVSYLGDTDDPESGKKTFELVMEAISLAASQTTFPPEFGENIDKANDIFESTSIVNSEGTAKLRESYQLINSGKKFEMPSSISSISDAVDYGKVQLAAARKDLKADNVDACVRKLVEIAVMIVTPMHRQQ